MIFLVCFVKFFRFFLAVLACRTANDRFEILKFEAQTTSASGGRKCDDEPCCYVEPGVPQCPQGHLLIGGKHFRYDVMSK